MKQHYITIKTTRKAQQLLRLLAAETDQKQYEVLEHVLSTALSQVTSRGATEPRPPIAPSHDDYTMARLLHYFAEDMRRVIAFPEDIEAAWEALDDYGRALWMDRAEAFGRVLVALDGVPVIDAQDIAGVLINLGPSPGKE